MNRSGFYQLPALRDCAKEIKLFASLVMLVLMVGYAHALVYVYVTTRIVPKGIEERYRGTEEQQTASVATAATSNDSSYGISNYDTAATASPVKENEQPKTVTGELQYQKTLPEMLNLVHTHVLIMSVIFGVSGLITMMTRVFPPGFRKFIIVEPFVGILVTFAGLWLTRYAHPHFSWLVALSGALMAFAFFAQCLALIYELRSKPTITL